MSPDGISSLVLAVVAVVISGISLFLSIMNKKSESLSSYRKYFFEKFIKNERLFDLAKLVSDLKSNKSFASEDFSMIHLNISQYLNEIFFLSVVDYKTYKTLHDSLIKIDDLAVVCVQRVKEWSDCSDNILIIYELSKQFFKELKHYYCGK